MANLYLTEQNSILRKTGDRLIVEKDEQVLLDVPCHKIQAVLIFGNVQFTTQAVHELFEHGIEMAILTRTGRLVGQLTSPATKNIFLRIAPVQEIRKPGFSPLLFPHRGCGQDRQQPEPGAAVFIQPSGNRFRQRNRIYANPDPARRRSRRAGPIAGYRRNGREGLFRSFGQDDPGSIRISGKAQAACHRPGQRHAVRWATP